MIMKKIILSFLIPFGSLTILFAGGDITQTLRGRVTDNVTGKPLIGATVVIKDSNPVNGTITGMNGEFSFPNIPLGRQSLEVSYIGYHTAIIPNLLLTSGKEVVVNINLEEKAYQVEEITIRPNKKKEEANNEMAVVSARRFSVEETERFAGSLGDPARMVANYAGVMTQNDSRNDIIIRGNSPSGVLWRLEGIEIANPNHFGAQGTTGGPVSMVNNNLLTDSDFLTGAFPAEFGNATAGAFDLNLRSGNNQKMEFTGQVGFNGFEGGIEGPFVRREKGPNPSFLANFRYSTLELVHDLGFSTGTGAAIPEYQDLTFLVDVPGTKAGRFKIFGLYGRSYIALGHEQTEASDNAYNERGTSTDFGSDLGVTGLTHNIFLGENTRISSTISHQRTSSTTKIDSLTNDLLYIPAYRGDQFEDRTSVSTKLRHKINARNNISAGLIIDQYNVDFQDSIKSTNYDRFIILSDERGSLAMLRGFADYQHKFPKGVTTYTGIHLQYSDINEELSIEPRLGLKIPAGQRGSFNLGFGVHSQLQPKTIYFSQSWDEATDRYYVTNRDLGFTKSNHFVAGYDYLFGKNFRVRLESYYQHLYNVPVKKSFPEFSMLNVGDQFGLPREDSLVNEGKGRNYGLELTLEKFLDKGYYLLFTASLFESEYQGYDKVWRNTVFNGNYVFNLLGGYEFKIGQKTMFTIDLKTVFAGGKRYLPVDIEASLEEDYTIYDYENAYEDKYDPYFRTDLRLGFKINGRKVSQEWGLDLQNVTNYQSVFMEGFDRNTGEVYQIYQQGFIPMFLYRIQF
jgi:hypothetical protein